MYSLVYADVQTKLMFSGNKERLDIEVQEELQTVLDTLKDTGEIEGASCGVRPGLVGLVYQIEGKTFQIDYTVDANKRQIKFSNLKLRAHHIAVFRIIDYVFTD